jgi:hypothetical protein
MVKIRLLTAFLVLEVQMGRMGSKKHILPESLLEEPHWHHTSLSSEGLGAQEVGGQLDQDQGQRKGCASVLRRAGKGQATPILVLHPSSCLLTQIKHHTKNPEQKGYKNPAQR